MFGIADKIRARLYRQIYGNAGVDGGTLSMDIPMREEYEDVKMYLIYVDMKARVATADDPNAACLLEPSNAFECY